MNEIKRKILDVSRDLFIEQGYKQTTTRQIIQKADILNGSLYHFFENKEDIFKDIIMDVDQEVIELAKSFAGQYSDSILILAFPMALHLYVVERHPKFAELFHEAYSSWPILELFTKNCANLWRELYQDYNPGLTEQDYYLRALSISGCIRSFIAESLFMGNIGYQEKLNVVLRMFQLFLNIPAFDVGETVAKIEKIINAEEIVIYGVRI